MILPTLSLRAGHVWLEPGRHGNLWLDLDALRLPAGCLLCAAGTPLETLER